MRRFREIDPNAPAPPSGWLVGVLVRLPGEREPVRHFWAVALDDRNKAEWAAADRAIEMGDIASSPFKGTEPVEAMTRIARHAFEWSGLQRGEVRALGWKWPRRWLAG